MYLIFGFFYYFMFIDFCIISKWSVKQLPSDVFRFCRSLISPNCSYTTFNYRKYDHLLNHDLSQTLAEITEYFQ